MRPCALVLLVGALLCVTATAHAQSRSQRFDKTGEVSVLADQMEERNGVLHARGNVEITHGIVRLVADEVEFDRATGVAIATGKVVFHDGQDRLTGERIEYDTRNGTGVVHRAHAFSAPYYRLSGEQIERLDESVYRVTSGIFTTCEDDPPTWSFHARTVTADLDDFVFGRDASFWVKNVPVIPFIPFFSAPIRRERQTGFLTPTLGSSSRRGLFAKVPFFWAINDSQDLMVSLDAYSERGIGANAEYRYVLSQKAQGALSGFVIHETLFDGDVRAYGGYKHSWTIDPSLSFRADLNVVSDDRVLRVYGDRLSERSLQRAESNVFLTKRWENWNFVANVLWYQDLTTDRRVELQRVPELKMQSVRVPVPGLPGFLYEVESSFTNFLREVGSEGARADLHPRIFRPIPVAGYFTVTPFLGGRATYYNTRVIGERAVGDRLIEQTEDANRIRGILELGTDVETRASKIYAWGGFWNVDRAQHVVEPRVGFLRAIATNASGIPRWDPIDDLGDRTRLTYSLTNRLLAKTVGGEDATPVRWEMVRFTVSQFYDFAEPEHGLGPVTADLIFQPGRAFQFRGDIEQGVRGEGLRRASADASVLVGDHFSATMGSLFNDRERVEFIRGQVTARLSPYLTVRGGTNWDVRESAFVENRIGVDLHWQCWAFSLTYITRKNDDKEVRVSLNLLGLGAVGTRTDIGF